MAVIIGIDIGVSSVGMAVLNEKREILESCSYIFPEADAANNAMRRDMRQGRRQKRRKKTRIDDFKKLWGDLPQSEKVNVVELRVKALNQKIELDELFAVLLNDLKNRGISYLDDILEEGSNDYSRGIAINQKELETKYPCEIQLERFNLIGSYRGYNSIVDEDKKITVSNIFTTSAYRREVVKTFETQKKYHKEITDEIMNKYLKIFDRKRKYYKGPGSELSRTDYGIYTTKIDSVTGELNIFEKLIGKCSVYPEERRAAGASYTAQEFNLLNDLNNLIVNGRKFEKEEKKKIVSEIINADSVNMRKIIKKVIGEEVESLVGYAIDKNEKEVYNHTFKIYKKMRKELAQIGKDITEISREDLDIIGEILTLNTDKESIEETVIYNGLNFSEEIVNCFVDIRRKNGSLFTKWQSNSLKLMNELIPEMYEQPKNQMELLTDMEVFKERTELYNNLKYIPEEVIVDKLYNPVVRRSVSISIKIINALIKKYKKIDSIIIEMPRDKNSDEQKKRINKIQNNNEKELENIIKKVYDEYGRKINDEDFKGHRKLALKLKLWNEQEGVCPYSGRAIQIFDLLDNPTLFEIDHIIPISVSFDDSRNNKVLVYQSENQDKGNKTPYMYLSSVNREWEYQKFQNYVSRLNVPRAKKENFLCTKDISKLEVLQGFVNRNIVDTRYASRVVLNSLQGFFYGKGTKVSVIKGSYTHQMRLNLKIEKNRDESYSHHAVDAMLIALSQMGYDSFKKIQEEFTDYETGEIIDYEKWLELNPDKIYVETSYSREWMKIRKNILDAEKNNKYWYKVDYKCNRGLCNQTIYGTREYEGKTYKISKLSLETNDGIKKFKNIIEKNHQDKLLVYKNDPKTFENIMIIYNEYKNEPNPFAAYEKETGDFVRKYSKNHNGPRISSLKYVNDEVNSCIDISHKYGHDVGSKKVILESLSPYRTDVYYRKDNNTYHLVGIKHDGIKCVKGKYVIDEEAYAKVLINEKMISEGQCREDLEGLGFEFRFSLYKYDIIQYEQKGEIFKERFLSRTKVTKNCIETKPLDKDKFDDKKDGRKIVGLSKTTLIRKIVTDMLGKEYYVKKEKFKEEC